MKITNMIVNNSMIDSVLYATSKSLISHESMADTVTNAMLENNVVRNSKHSKIASEEYVISYEDNTCNNCIHNGLCGNHRTVFCTGKETM